MRNYQIVIYGSYGYTGQLIVDECKAHNLEVLLSGRNESKLKAQSDQSGYRFETVDIDDHKALVTLLAKVSLVIHCGGPFQFTAKQMVNACLEAGTHYIDITGEIPVFEQLSEFDLKAKEQGIIIMPGTGFDVVPSDCLAVHLKNRLPDATHLQLAFAMSKGGVSRGTAKTMTEGLGYGGLVRKDGKLTGIALGDIATVIDFGPFKRNALCIPWGDVATAWRSTGIPNIEIYTGVPKKMITLAKLSRWANWLLKKRFIKNYLLKRIDNRLAGPDADRRETGRSYLYGKVYNNKGEVVEARLETLSGYSLTAKTSVLIATKILNENNQPGYYTPAQYFGAELILEIETTKLS